MDEIKRSCKFPEGWVLTENGLDSVSIIRTQNFYINEQRAVTEVRLQRITTGETKLEVLSKGVVASAESLELAKETQSMKVGPKAQLIVEFLDRNILCKGFQLETSNDYIHAAGYRTVVIKSLDESTEREMVIANDCKIIAPGDGQCCTSCTRLKKAHSKNNKRRKPELSKFTNERFMTNDALRQKTACLRKQVLCSNSREDRLKAQIEKEMVEIHDEDNKDLAAIMQKIDSEKVPESLKFFWEQQVEILQTKSSKGHRWHPK